MGKADSVETVMAQFIERHIKRSTRPRSAKEMERLIRAHVLPRWRDREMQHITRRDVLDMLDRVVDRGAPISANRVFSVTRKFFNWCVERDIIHSSPCTNVKPPTIRSEFSRDRILTDDELRLVWCGAEAVGWPFGTLVQLLILTGQRRDECAQMQSDELDLKKRLWTLQAERVKNNQKHEVPLSNSVVAILQGIPCIHGSPFVLTTNGKAPASGYSKGKRRLDALLPADLPAWCLHDLRRSAASGLARLGISLPVIEKILNHVSGSFSEIVGVYQHHQFAEEKRKALEVWANHVTAVVADNPAKVVSLRGPR